MSAADVLRTPRRAGLRLKDSLLSASQAGLTRATPSGTLHDLPEAKTSSSSKRGESRGARYGLTMKRGRASFERAPSHAVDARSTARPASPVVRPDTHRPAGGPALRAARRVWQLALLMV